MWAAPLTSLAAAQPLNILSRPETLNASGSRRACRMANSRNASSLPDFPEFAQAVRYGVPGTPRGRSPDPDPGGNTTQPDDSSGSEGRRYSLGLLRSSFPAALLRKPDRPIGGSVKDSVELPAITTRTCRSAAMPTPGLRIYRRSWTGCPTCGFPTPFPHRLSQRDQTGPPRTIGGPVQNGPR
jgi:hypothetical protein